MQAVRGDFMKVIERHVAVLRASGLAPTLVRAPTEDDPVGVVSFAAPDRLYAVFSDEREPRFVRVTTGMGFNRSNAPDPAVLLHLANDCNQSFRFVRTVVQTPERVEFVFEAMVEDSERLPDVIEAAVPALSRVADSFFDRMYLPDRAEA